MKERHEGVDLVGFRLHADGLFLATSKNKRHSKPEGEQYVG